MYITSNYSLCLMHCCEQFQPQLFLNVMPLSCVQFGPFLFAEPFKLHQVGRKTSVFSHFQISVKTFQQIQVWALAGPLRVLLKPPLWYLDCMLGFIFLLKDEPSNLV
ncbi:hypothetical protein ATANTOWER_030592 [Ataeniobius toweri]|uniref:Uncharacterized protein n=1 Tax=Ataeniobius toweri TaxID=208326 RepID=A0ABU7B0X2_9TELE|nr:hypothetical protein [Ataeniobius toweri]